MEKIWIKSYQEGVPAEVDINQFTSLVDWLQLTCDKFHDKIAFSQMGATLTYQQLHALSRQFAAYLQQNLHLDKGERVAIMLPNCFQYPVCLFGILSAGLIVVNVNPLYTADELAKQIKDSGANTLIAIESFADTVEEALKQVPIKNIILTRFGDMFSPLRSIIINFAIKYIHRKIPNYQLATAISFKRVLKKSAKLSLKALDIQPDDVALLQYTGGTTGVAKGAELMHRNILANLAQIEVWLKPNLNPGEARIITALPLYHIFSLTANCFTFMHMGGENILIVNPRDLNSVIKVLKQEKFNAITGVNTLFNALIHHSQFKNIDFSHLRIVLGGGMAVQRAVANKWYEITGCALLQAYGLTEASPAVAINPLNMTEYNDSIGLPIPSTEISIRDDTGNEVLLGQAGELCVRGPQVMRAYWQQPEETAKVLDKDGWLRTGDIATMDENGFLQIVDRKKDMILVSGFNVYPNQVEEVIAHCPGVVEVAVIGEKNSQGLETVKAFVVKNDEALTVAKLQHHCREHLTSYKVPKKIVFMDELPKTSVGKILRRELRS